MSISTVPRELAEEQSRPAAFLVDAMQAVLEDDPDRPIELAAGVYVRASYLVRALAPEALERATAQQSLRADLVERVHAYTQGAA